MQDPPSQRLWRLRKLHQSADVHLHRTPQGRFELRFLYNGEPAYARQCGTYEEALAEAAEKRAELEREGWTAHW